jgi:hypothetical protein
MTNKEDREEDRVGIAFGDKKVETNKRAQWKGREGKEIINKWNRKRA